MIQADDCHDNQDDHDDYNPTWGMMQGARHFGTELLHFPSAKHVAWK